MKVKKKFDVLEMKMVTDYKKKSIGAPTLPLDELGVIHPNDKYNSIME